MIKLTGIVFLEEYNILEYVFFKGESRFADFVKQ